MPIRRVPVLTAPAMTLPMMRTAMSTPSTPNAMRNGTSSTVCPCAVGPGGEPGPRAGQRARRDGRLHRGPARVDLRGGVGRGEAVEHLVAARAPGGGQRRDLLGDHPAAGGLADRPGQCRPRSGWGCRAGPAAVSTSPTFGWQPPGAGRRRAARSRRGRSPTGPSVSVTASTGSARIGPPDHRHRRHAAGRAVDRGDRRGRERARPPR